MSDFEISVHHPDLPDDTEFDIQGVGLVKNGSTSTVTDGMQEAFEADTGYVLKDCLEENPIIGVGKKKPNTETGKRTPNEVRSDQMAAGTYTEPVVEDATPVDPVATPSTVAPNTEGGES